MTALTASRTALLFISVNSYRQFAFQFCPRSQEVALLTPLPILRHSRGIPNGRKGRRQGRGGRVCVEEDMNGSHDLESEIYEFMERSANRMDFPSRDELIAAGKGDLARAIAKEGGWLAYGWDLDEEEGEETVSSVSDSVGKKPCEECVSVFQHRMSSVSGEAEDSLKTDLDSFWASSEESSGPSTSGRLMDTEVPQDAGIEGILIRLEKERGLAFGFVSSKEDESVGSMESTGMCVSSNLGGGLRVQNSHHGSLLNANCNSERGTWRSWSIERSGDPLSNVEAAEIVLEEDRRKLNLNFDSHYLIEKEKENITVGRLASGKNSGNNCPYDNYQGNFKTEISVHPQHLESQLTSALHLNKSRSAKFHSYEDKDQESLLKQLHSLSDALEFQQNEIKNARDILRSIKAKLVIMEGKVALEVIESQKVIEEKEKRLVASEWSLRSLHSVCIVWPNSASEVLLAGSFDGWTSQWRMEKNSSGVFSLFLKLYPGRYEIKFIVDGVWAVDPLLPMANNNGFKNNLLIVT